MAVMAIMWRHESMVSRETSVTDSLINIKLRPKRNDVKMHTRIARAVLGIFILHLLEYLIHEHYIPVDNQFQVGEKMFYL